MKLVQSYHVEKDADHYQHVQLVRVAASDINKNGARAIARRLADDEYLPPLGCDCGHCASGYDCCGRLVAVFRSVDRVKRGIKITTHYARNI